jgi:hydroxymethylpyrimidine pyrophosphatase-like HAD family hydrolase
VNDAEKNATRGKPANASEANGQAQNDKSKFNWVTGRFHCSLAAVFRELRLEVEEDVKTRNGLRLANALEDLMFANY